MVSGNKVKKLKAIAVRVSKCTRCSLYKRANKPVPGEGCAEAEIMFIGEAPGYHEDLRGIPFCGAAGRLLDHLLQSIKVKREEVFIGNTLKHRPPGNRDPLPEEIEACRPFLDEQIDIINPKIVVTLGRFSMGKFLPGKYISRIHGQAQRVNFNGQRRIIFPLYHPAAALRNPQVMASIKEDFLKIPLFLKLESNKLEEEAEIEIKSENEQLSLIK